ncbi:MAG: hypothetical protein LBB65_08940 [Burkholderiales bacterium]|nr:hypothetical protein [Burkholderiales bacterium]
MSTAIPHASPSSSEPFTAMNRNSARDLLHFAGAALMAGLVSSLALMAAILILAVAASS